jgi:hypothetical protein
MTLPQVNLFDTFQSSLAELEKAQEVLQLYANIRPAFKLFTDAYDSLRTIINKIEQVIKDNLCHYDINAELLYNELGKIWNEVASLAHNLSMCTYHEESTILVQGTEFVWGATTIIRDGLDLYEDDGDFLEELALDQQGYERLADEYEQDEEEAINRDIEKIKAVVEPFLKGWFGDRCPDFDENCLLCKRWQHYDQLIKSPFRE